MTSLRYLLCAMGLATLFAACSSAPPPPDWQMNAKGSMERALAAYLQGNARLEALESTRARADVARTGKPELLARIELMRCAARVASLVFEECPAFAALAQDASVADRAYADYLAGKSQPQDAALLPAQHRDAATGKSPAETVGAIGDPLSKLVAAGVLLRGGRAQPGVFAVAIDTASAQGWSRPLLAWLNAQAQRAEAAGDGAEAARLRRRIAVVLEGAPHPSKGL